VLAKQLGEAPRYDSEQEPKDYCQQLLQWGMPPGASLAACLVERGGELCIDEPAMHAAGCYPHRWTVPLTAAGVQAANKAAARDAAADPTAVAREAVPGQNKRDNQKRDKQRRDKKNRWNAGTLFHRAGMSDAAAAASAANCSGASQATAPSAAAAAVEALAPTATAPAEGGNAERQQLGTTAQAAGEAGEAGEAGANALDGPRIGHWTRDAEGWWRCCLTLTACNHSRLGMPGVLARASCTGPPQAYIALLAGCS
jgi:hypothetical protein